MDQDTEKNERTSTATRTASGTTGLVKPAKGGELQSVMQILLIATVGSTIISLYILWIGLSGHHKKNVDVASSAALYAAQQLSQISVDSNVFGRVGLCDSAGDDAATFNYSGPSSRVTGLNTIYRTLDADQSIAKHLNRQIMLDLIDKDRQQAQKLEAELSQRLREAAEPDLMDAQNHENSGQLYGTNSQSKQNNIYRDVYRMLASDKSAPKLALIEVRLKLGRSKPVPNSPSWPTGKIRILENAELFESTRKDQAPYIVLVEAVYQTRTKHTQEAPQTVIKKSCAIISSPAFEPRQSALMLNFPNGLPSKIDSGDDLLNSSALRGDGEWQQVTGNEVPGKGSLAPTLQPVLPGMSPSDAFSVALYHWLRVQGPNVNAEKLDKLLTAKWTGSSAVTRFKIDEQVEAVNPNSCLAIDTGARQYAVLNQTGAGAIGQTAISKAFDIYTTGLYGTAQNVFPQSAMPLFVDADGNCNIAGRNGYDKGLITDYMTSVYKTNLAAIESAAIARMVIARTAAELAQLDQRMFIERQEISSIENRLSHLGKQTTTPPNEVSRQIGLANEKLDALKALLAEQEDNKASLRQSTDAAQAVSISSNQVAASTFDLCAQSFKVCKDGIYRLDAPQHSFIVSKKLIFTPCVTPTDESDFFKHGDNDDSHADGSHADGSHADGSHADGSHADGSHADGPHGDGSHTAAEASKPWLDRTFDAVRTIENAKLNTATATVEGTTLSKFLNAPIPKQHPNASLVFFTTEALFDKDQPKPLLTNFNPFSNVRLPNGQLFYYCKDALQTGSEPKVSWSLVIRDLVASVGQNAYGQQTGDPIASDHQQDWYKLTNQSICPGLACELQLRTPLPVITNSAEASLSNPLTKSQVQQIPPVPPDML